MKARFAYTGIRVKDMDATVRFYTQVLGMTARGPTTIDSAKGVVMDLLSEEGGHPLELNFYGPGSPFDSSYDPGAALDHLAFQVGNLDEAIAEAGKLGHPVVQEMRTSTSRWVYIEDPNGIWIELFA